MGGFSIPNSAIIISFYANVNWPSILLTEQFVEDQLMAGDSGCTCNFQVEKNLMTMDQPQAEGDDLHYKDLLHLTCVNEIV